MNGKNINRTKNGGYFLLWMKGGSFINHKLYWKEENYERIWILSKCKRLGF